MARQASILTDKAEASLLMAKGGFDPLLNTDASNKTFDSKNYYFYTNPEIKVPLPIGNLRMGLESNGGELLSTENTKGKSSYFGLELPLAQGLITDKRRTALQQAKIYRNLAEQEKQQLINDLLFDAYNTYWQWSGQYRLYLLYTTFISIAERRLQLVKIGFEQGDRSAMDTIEAATQLQNYKLLETENRQRYLNASLELSNYLWLENDSAAPYNEKIIPDTFSMQNYEQQKLQEEILAISATQNPALKTYDFKRQSLQAEKKLKKQNLLPYVSLKANLLYKDYSLFKSVEPVYWQNNYKWGVNISIPLFMREARGDYKNTQLKIRQNELDFLYKKRQIETKIKKELKTYKTQIKRLSNAYKTPITHR
jgi:outer membrane protein TolC